MRGFAKGKKWLIKSLKIASASFPSLKKFWLHKNENIIARLTVGHVSSLLYSAFKACNGTNLLGRASKNLMFNELIKNCTFSTVNVKTFLLSDSACTLFCEVQTFGFPPVTRTTSMHFNQQQIRTFLMRWCCQRKRKMYPICSDLLSYDPTQCSTVKLELCVTALWWGLHSSKTELRGPLQMLLCGSQLKTQGINVVGMFHDCKTTNNCSKFLLEMFH